MDAEDASPLLPAARRRSIWESIWEWFESCGRKKKYNSRLFTLGKIPQEKYPSNKISNQKYSLITFFPLVLYEQFRFFLNAYFLLMALSQLFPILQIGYAYTYWAPLGFVIAITIIREAIEDNKRYRRDRCINYEEYERVILDGEHKGKREEVISSNLRVGDIVHLRRGQRVPADLLLLSANQADCVFVSTDQLDGETDWKNKDVVEFSKNATDFQLLDMGISISAEEPKHDINSFFGKSGNHELLLPNMLWAGSVLQSLHITGLVIYTGEETRSAMNNSMPRSKVGQFDLKVNKMTIVLFGAMVLLASLMISIKGFSGSWYYGRFILTITNFFRFLLLFSYIIPISLRVNLEIGKLYYAWSISRDKEIEGSIMRSTQIPEEMGRISHLLTDKTGTITKNEMEFKKIYLSNTCYEQNNFHEIQTLLTQHITKESSSGTGLETPFPSSSDVWDTVLAIALCHNVTPVYDTNENINSSENDRETAYSVVSESNGGTVPQQKLCNYQAANPDEVALVKWTDTMGISLYERNLSNISLKIRVTNRIRNYRILHTFPFSSETKCMGIIVQNTDTHEITFYLKGADVVLINLVGSPHLVENHCRSLAAEGLRTLVFAKKQLDNAVYDTFVEEYSNAGQQKRSECIQSYLHCNLQLLGITGVEDHLADEAASTINILQSAGIKIWMLTGDKLETAECIYKSLHTNIPNLFNFNECKSKEDIHSQLMHFKQCCNNSTLIISGDNFKKCMERFEAEFTEVITKCSSLVIARCSPTQKANAVRVVKKISKGSVCAIGDGGNDVPMIREADIGIGLEGKEGKAAALASDVSTSEFCNLRRLILVHGRRSRLRSSTLSFFVIYRGLVISIMQAIFSVVFYLSSVSLYQGVLMVCYGTIFTMFPVFSLVLDKDITGSEALNDPIHYRNLVKQRIFSYKLLFLWVSASIYQGAIIMYGALLLFKDEFIHIVSISFSALVFSEYIMIAFIIHRCHWLIWAAELFSFFIYIAALFILPDYFDIEFILSWIFLLKVLCIIAVCSIPLLAIKLFYRIYLRKA